jgi:hypothetical protein
MDEEQQGAEQSELQALTKIVKGLPRTKSLFNYKDLKIESRSFGSPDAFTSILSGWFYGVVDRVFKKRRGWSFRVYLPQTLAFDLWMESRWQRLKEGDTLDRLFQWTAINRDSVREAFSDEILDAIVELDSAHRLVLTDEWLRIGPISHKDSAATIAKIIDRVASLAYQLAEKAASDRIENEVEQAEQAEPVPEPEGPYKVVHRCTDTMQAEFVQGVLVKHGIPSQVIGTRIPALIGAAPHIFRLKVRVPESQVARAEQILEGLKSDPKSSESNWISSIDEAIFQKKRAVAFGMCFFLPGGGHIYALRPITGALIGLAVLGALFCALLIEPARIGVVLLFLGVTSDLVGSQLAFGRMKTGKLPRAAWQAFAGLAWVLVILIVGWILLALIGPPSGYDSNSNLYLPFFYW